MQGHETERTKTGDGYEVVCVQCGNTFFSKRYDASFCSNACRTAHNRDVKAMKDHIWRYGANARSLVRDINAGKLPKKDLINMAREIVALLQPEIEYYDQTQYEKQQDEKRIKKQLGLSDDDSSGSVWK